jgi:hypothetical protein
MLQIVLGLVLDNVGELSAAPRQPVRRQLPLVRRAAQAIVAEITAGAPITSGITDAKALAESL